MRSLPQWKSWGKRLKIRSLHQWMECDILWQTRFLWSYGGVSALYKVQNEVIWDSPTISSNRWRFHKQKRSEVVWRTEINLKSPTEFGRQSTKNPLGLVLQAHLWDCPKTGSQGAWCGEVSDTWSWTRRSSVDLSEAFPPRRRRRCVRCIVGSIGHRWLTNDPSDLYHFAGEIRSLR